MSKVGSSSFNKMGTRAAPTFSKKQLKINRPELKSRFIDSFLIQHPNKMVPGTIYELQFLLGLTPLFFTVIL